MVDPHLAVLYEVKVAETTETKVRLTLTFEEDTVKGLGALAGGDEKAGSSLAGLGDAVAPKRGKTPVHLALNEQHFHKGKEGQKNMSTYMEYMAKIFEGNFGALLDDAGNIKSSRLHQCSLTQVRIFFIQLLRISMACRPRKANASLALCLFAVFRTFASLLILPRGRPTVGKWLASPGLTWWSARRCGWRSSSGRRRIQISSDA